MGDFTMSFSRKTIIESASSGVVRTKEWTGTVKDRLLNMDIPAHLETSIKNKLRNLTAITTAVALIALYVMYHTPAYFLTALMVGFIASSIDFVVEYKGVSGNDWDYPAGRLSFRRIPLELPILFFSCGVLITFAYCCFSTPVMKSAVAAEVVFPSVNATQICLSFMGVFFMTQYFRKKCNSIVFGALPISLALYLAYPEPWVLAVSVLPIYIDYYLEKNLVSSAHIRYNRYDDEVALNVAISYFPATLLILALVALIYHMF